MKFKWEIGSAATARRAVARPHGAAAAAERPLINVGQLDRSAILDLQRTAGNGATARLLLQRSNGPTRHPTLSELARLLKELNERGVAQPAQKPPKPSALWQWMKRSPNWLRAIAAALGMKGAVATGGTEIQIPNPEKPAHVKKAEQDARQKRGSKGRGQGGSDPPTGHGRGRGQGLEGGTRHPTQSELARLVKELHELGVAGQEQPPSGRPGTHSKGGGGKGTGGRLFGIAGGLIEGAIAGAAMEKRIEEKRSKTGYAEPGSEYWEGSGAWGRLEAGVRAGRNFFAGEVYPMSDRFDVGVWRRSLRMLADRVPNDDTLEIGWQVQVGWKEALNPLLVARGLDVADIKTVRVFYRKMSITWGDPPIEAVGWSIDTQKSQHWPASAALDEPPSLNYILNPAHSDSDVESYLLVPFLAKKA